MRLSIACGAARLVACLLACLLGASAASAGEQWIVPPEEAAKWHNPVLAADRDASIARGAASYEKNCTMCHGSKGRGDGEVAKSLPQKTPDLTTDSAQAQSDAVLFVKISSGKRPMIGYARLLSEAERWDLVNYLRTLRAKK